MKSVRFLVFISFLGVAAAQSGGNFAKTADMHTGRDNHTSTLLQDGRVLITGGVIYVNLSMIMTAEAELFDPSTGSFAATGRMSTARWLHTATLLPDGRVLIAGGNDGSNHPSLIAELYDPSTGTFSATGSMSAPHDTATLLNDGRVLMGPPSRTASLELYDPSTGSFSAAGVYADNTSPSPTTDSATLLADGRVLISSDSYISPGRSQLVAGVYDPTTGTFSPTGPMLDAAYDDAGSATLLTNGQVLYAGGASNTADGVVSASAELYDPFTGSFASAGIMLYGHAGHTATLLPDGRVLIGGAATYKSKPCCGGPIVQGSELYDPSTGSFSFAGDMMNALRIEHKATLLNDGRVLITGGSWHAGDGAPLIFLSSAEIYSPATLIPAPALSSLSGDGKGQGFIWRVDTGQIASPSSPAAAGDVLSMYTTNLADDGVIPPQVAVGGRLAPVLYFGRAPGNPGYDQVNFRVPGGVDAGPSVPVRLTYIGRPSNEVTISLVPPLIVTDLQFDQTTVVAGSSYSVNISGSNLTSQTFFDVRFISPESNVSAVVLNWQRGLTASHTVPPATAPGTWTIIGVRAHQIETDHTRDFIPVSAPITVSP